MGMSSYGTLTEKQKRIRRKASINWAKRNPEKRKLIFQNWIKKRLIWYEEIKKNLSCEKCGESDSVCLDFHHKDKETKNGNISDMIKDFGNNEIILKEIKKCIVLCANCHRKIHGITN